MSSLQTVVDYVTFRPTGKSTASWMANAISQKITDVRRRQMARLLVNLSELEHDEPSLADRYFAIQVWAQAAGYYVAVALVLRPEVIEVNGFGAIIARNAGLRLEYFASDSEAVEWLRNQ